MKTRNGFVSNSSSSSFIVRGIKINEKNLSESLGIDLAKIKEDGENLMDTLYRAMKKFKSKLQVEEDRYYFGGESTGNWILGFETDSDDGWVVEIKDDPENDKEIIQALDKIGVKDIDKLSTTVSESAHDL